MSRPDGLGLVLVSRDARRAERLSGLVRAASRRSRVTTVASPEAAHRAVSHGGGECVLVDLDAADRDTDLLSAVRAATPGVPVLGVVEDDDEATALRALRDGAQDCVAVGDLGAAPIARTIRFAVERHRTQQELVERAFLDPLTGLPQRKLLMDRLDHALAQLPRVAGGVAVLFLDLDGFKPVNDTLGHAVGDRALVGVARRLNAIVRPGDTVARYGGDEFVVLCENAASHAGVLAAAQRVVRAMRRPMVLGGHRLRLGASVGVAFADTATVTSAALLDAADAAMYEAKRRGGGMVVQAPPHTVHSAVAAPAKRRPA